MRCSIAFLVAAAVGCNTSSPVPQSSSPPAPVPSAAPSAPPTAVAGALRLGEPIESKEVLLADVAKDPTGFAGKSFATRGTVTAVCQEMGCWMEIKDASSGAHIKMHGHSFFVPKTASGHQARVQATLVAPGAAKGCDEAECAPKDMAQLQLDATGVELL